MSQLNQIQLRFIAREDRVLLRVNTTSRSEFRFWITRRYAKLLWSALSKLLALDPHIQTATDAHAKQTILAFQHESALSQANFSRSFEKEATQLPLGEAPVLLARVQVKQLADGRRVLCLHPETGHGVELALPGNLLHAFARLLADASAQADWDLGSGLSVAQPTPPQQLTVN